MKFDDADALYLVEAKFVSAAGSRVTLKLDPDKARHLPRLGKDSAVRLFEDPDGRATQLIVRAETAEGRE